MTLRKPSTRIVHFSQVCLSVYWGALTFYAAVVVPTGTEVLDSMSQGFVTQRVTHWLNAFCLVALTISGPVAVTSGQRWRIGLWCLAGLALGGLFVLHPELDRLLDQKSLAMTGDYDTFYARHRWYLWLTAAQWLSVLGLLIPPPRDLLADHA